MALVRIGFFSKVLGMCTSCDVILPQQTRADAPSAALPTLYLLHNLTKSHSSWQRMTSIERYALHHGVAVILPDAHLSSYADMLHGGKFFTYIADELPEIMRGFFPLSNRREDTFLCGSSMGGYGALKIGLNRPMQYGAIGSLSAGYTSYRGIISEKDDRGISLQMLTFGEDGLDREDADTAAKARAIVESGEKPPRVFVCCGSEDPLLLEDARKARDFFASFEGNPFEFEYSEPSGGHNWAFWDQHICDFLRFAGLTPHAHMI